MPPVVGGRSSEDESVDDIPYEAPRKKQETMSKGKGKRKSKAEPTNNPQEDAPQDDEDMDDAEDEYAVERIVSHRFEPDGTLKLEVKWIGWDDSSNTWEPEENLEGALEELNKYYEEIGGKPVFGTAKTRKTVPATKTVAKKEPAATQSTKSRKRAAEDTPPAEKTESRRRSKAQKRIKAQDSDGDDSNELTIDGVKGKMVTLPKGSWEDRINSISTITKEEDGTLIATVIWDDGSHQKHLAKVLNVRCPQRMLQFYESHLQFKDIKKYAPYEDEQSAEEDDAIQDASLAGIDALLENVGEGVTSMEEGVKRVASSVTKSVASTFASVKDVVTKNGTPRSTPKGTSSAKKQTSTSMQEAEAAEEDDA